MAVGRDIEFFSSIFRRHSGRFCEIWTAVDFVESHANTGHV